MTRTLDVDYLVVGAGAMGMGFTDVLVDHGDARVAVVDRRHGAGGHWLEDYPFVRLHQASTFYGVASTVLGGQVQQQGPEAGLLARASQPEIVEYYARAVERLRATGRVEVLTGCDVVGRTVVSRISARTWEVPASCRVVDARYLSPSIPAESSAPFSVADDARAVTVNDLVRLEEAPSRYVVVGSGKTATDACVWLLGQGVDPDAICWVRPRDPWMLDRALIQPDPAVYLGVPATTFEQATASSSLDELFLRLEDAGVMLRIDRSVTPTMAKAPTLGRWELELLRSIERRRPPRAPAPRGARAPGAGGRRRRARRGRRGGRALRGRRAEEPSARAGLAARGHHPAAGPGRVPVLRGRGDGLRRGDPAGRRGEEPPLPAVALRQLAAAVGRHERPRDAGDAGPRGRARHRGVGEHRGGQPGPHPAGSRRVRRARPGARAAGGGHANPGSRPSRG